MAGRLGSAASKIDRTAIGCSTQRFFIFARA
jgi:hypothetical protein